MKTIQKYVCEYCDREYRSLRGIEKHEPMCYRNPITKSCVTCEHFVAQEYDQHRLEFGADVCSTSTSLLCEDNHDGSEFGGRELKSYCPFWQVRTSNSNCRIGKNFVRKIDN